MAPVAANENCPYGWRPVFATEIDIPVAGGGDAGMVATIVAAVSYWNCNAVVCPIETDAFCTGGATSWSPTPPSTTLTA